MKRTLGFASVALLLSACGQISTQEPVSSVKALPNRWLCTSISNDGPSHRLMVVGFASNGQLIPSRVKFSLFTGGWTALDYVTPRITRSDNRDTTQPSFSAGFVYDAPGYQVQFDIASMGAGQIGTMGGSVRYTSNGRIVSLPAVGCRAF